MTKTEQIKPLTLIVLGVTGDLARKKLIPAFFDLALRKKLPEVYEIIGFSNEDLNTESFKEFVLKFVPKKDNPEYDEVLKKFINSVSYVKGNFFDKGWWSPIVERVKNVDKENNFCSDKLIYLATQPKFYETILMGIDESGLSIPCEGDESLPKILIEKPFGTDAKTALKLENLLTKFFKEEQIFRIDHYLAKETVQNILTFRFSNTIFEPVWNKKFIESVHIFLSEEKGIEGRGPFFDSLGELRDVGQNHLLQMLAIISMENPGEFSFKKISENRTKIFSKIHLGNVKNFVRGQYEGYLNEKGVNQDSKTETYFFVEAIVKNSRWNGVPFYLEAGKSLAKNEVKITINFKPEAFCLKPPLCNMYSNQLTFHIQPKEEINLKFWKKKPGFGSDLESKDFSFSYDSSSSDYLGAYEKVLFDALSGDKTLFATTKEIKFAWNFIKKASKILEEKNLLEYKVGSDFNMGELVNVK